MSNEAKLDSIVDKHRARDVDAEFDEVITDADYPEPEPEPKPRINQAIKLGAMLADLLNAESFDGLITIGSSVSQKKPSVHVTADYFNRHLADNWEVKTKDIPLIGMVEKSIDFEPCKIFCMENAEFVRREK